jgi:hypothetical protein
LTDHADDPEVYDEFINAQIVLHNEGEPKHGRVIKRARGSDGRPIGRCHPGDTWNPELGSRDYVVQFDDGTIGTQRTSSPVTSSPKLIVMVQT